jgi:hypothetical protein
MQNEFAFLQASRMTRLLGQGSTQDERAWNAFRALAEAARALNARDGGNQWGLEKDPSGDFRPVIAGVGYWGDGLRTRTEGNDVIGDREGTGARWTWGTPKGADLEGERGFILPPPDSLIVREMAARGYPDRMVDAPPATPDDTRLASLERAVSLLTGTVGDHENLMTGLADRIEDLQVQITNLQHLPPPLTDLQVDGEIVFETDPAQSRPFRHKHGARVRITLPVVRK